MTDPRLTKLAASLPASVPFVGPESQERARGRPFRARLGANENVFGPSPQAIAAMARAAAESWMYGDPESHALKRALAAHHGIDPAHIVLGEGIDGLLGYLVRLTVAEGTPVVTSQGAYPTFNYHVTGFGGALHMVPYREDAEDPDALTAKAREVGAPLIYLANPDNPMGRHHGPETVAAMIDALPDGALLALDEAYCEFAPEAALLPLAPEDDRVIRFRTFSKAYGLAGARVGYAIGPKPLIAAFDRVRNHFGIGRTSQAGALAALHDQDWLARILAEVAAARGRITAIARENGLTALPSAANFVAIDCGRDGAFATRVLQELGQRDVFVRMPFVAPQNRCIRISAGRPADLDIVAAELPRALEAAKV